MIRAVTEQFRHDKGVYMRKLNTPADEAKRPRREARPEAGKFPRKAVPVTLGNTDPETARNFAEVLTSPELAAYRVINGAELKSGIGEHIDVPAVMAQLREQATAANAGNLATVEAMLMNQATALQSLFARLAERGMGCENADPFECNMRMALRAQSQCRATLETLAAIKNPPVVYARQANVTTGPQQVNNGVVTRTRESENLRNELDGGMDATMDTGGPAPAIGADLGMATVGMLDGAEDAGGQGEVQSERRQGRGAPDVARTRKAAA